MRNIKVTTNNVRTPTVEDYDKWEQLAQLVLTAYFVLLRNWRIKFMPPSNNSALDRRYIESLKKYDYVWILRYRFENGSKAERLAMKDEIDKFEERLYKYHRSCIACKSTGCSAGGF